MADACILCGGATRLRYVARDRMHGVPGEFRVRACTACGLLALEDPPTGDALARHYPETYYAHAGGNDEPASPREERRARLWRHLYRARYDPSFRHPMRPLLRSLKRTQVRGLALGDGLRLLDVGCGDGRFLAFARSLGLDVAGVEPGAAAAARARARGLDVRTGTLREARFPDASFDVVTFNHVFEHLPDPHETLDEARRVLADDGLLVVAVPNADSLARRVFGARWVQLDAPRHLYGWSPRTLRALAERHALRVERVRWLSTPFQVTGSLRYVWNDLRRGPPRLLDAPGGLMRSPLVHAALVPVAGALNALLLGDTVEVWMRKGPGGRMKDEG